MAARKPGTGERVNLETRLDIVEGRIEGIFTWIRENPRPVLLAIGVFFISGASIAALSEYRTRAQELSQSDLGKVEMDFARAMGAVPGALAFMEPANPEQGERAREIALEGFKVVIAEHAGTRAAELGSIRAAEIEVDLARGEDAELRLVRLTGQLDEDDALRAVALRLLGTVRTDAGNLSGGAYAYAEAAAVGDYQDSGPLWIAAGRGFAASGLNEQAIEAYNEALVVDMELAAEARIADRISALEVLIARSPGSGPGAVPADSQERVPEGGQERERASAETPGP